ncbi:MAG: metal-dependent transcriptional regulator [Clostridiales bacterium]|nr:metal-dependent transcriptional regulator [Clostridiales bacterium]MCD8369086.1 metal-dependent transcriptional regulator [Clostridiales bacterium]
MEESGENYLKAIYILGQRNGTVRNKDLVEYMGYSKASVSVAVHRLEKKGYVAIDRKKLVLTEEGKRRSQRVLEQYEFWRDVLIHWGIGEIDAEREACSIEHALSNETFERVRDHLGWKSDGASRADS